MSNTPYTNGGFKLDVLPLSNDNYLMQEIRCNAADSQVYRRRMMKSGDTWVYASWYEVIQSTDGIVPITQGGTGATSASAALSNLGAASLGANTFTGNQLLNNNVKIRTARADGTAMNLLYMSENNNIIMGSSDYTDTQPIIMYGNPDIRGYIKLDGSSYGTSLPTAGTAGRIFFKKVSS